MTMVPAGNVHGPAPGNPSPWNPVDPVWGTTDHLNRISFLAPVAPVAAPAGMGVQTGDPRNYLQCLQNYARVKVEPELIQDRVDLWALDSPPWMYLKAETRDAHMNFHHWHGLITKDLQCEGRSLDAFVQLFGTNPPEAPYGFHEASRILAHMLKDKMKHEETYWEMRDSWSGFLAKACNEALEALDDPQHVKTLKLERKGARAWMNMSVPPPGGPDEPVFGTWSESRPYDGLQGGWDKGKGKGKGGKVYAKGHR